MLIFAIILNKSLNKSIVCWLIRNGFYSYDTNLQGLI